MPLLFRRSAVGVTTSTAGFYAAGHWDPAELTMRLVYPRPNAETPTWARHRWAYYDGTNSVPYEIDIGVMGGAWPFVYELIDGPAGMAIGRAYGDANYGKLTWTPSGSVTADPVHVRVTDQEGTQIDVQYTISTSSSLSVFRFVATTGNDTTGDGSYSAPFLTPQKLIGLTEGALTDYPNTIVYFRGGTYGWFDQGNNFGAQLSQDNTPTALLGFPGETVTHDISSGGSAAWLSCNGSAGNDIYLRGFSFTGTTAAANYRYIFFGGVCNRITYGHMSLPNVFAGSSPTDNATFGYLPSNTSLRQYVFAHDIFESNRTGSNSGGAFTAFTTQYLLAQNITCETPSAGFDCHFKASCQDCELRETFIGNHTGMQCQIDSSIPFTRVQIRHVKVQGQFEVNNGFSGANVGTIVVNRCSTLRLDVNDTCTSVKFVNNAVQSPAGLNPVRYNRTNAALPVWATNTGTECQASGTSAIIDEATMNLIGAYRTSYYGTANSRGAEIA